MDIAKLRKNAKWISIVVLVLLLGTLIFQNSAPIQTHFLMITITMPQILLLALVLGGGFCLGLLAAWRIKG